jgi:hypothetical protein
MHDDTARIDARQRETAGRRRRSYDVRSLWLADEVLLGTLAIHLAKVPRLIDEFLAF